jgi:hypothetical protein
MAGQAEITDYQSRFTDHDLPFCFVSFVVDALSGFRSMFTHPARRVRRWTDSPWRPRRTFRNRLVCNHLEFVEKGVEVYSSA